MAVFRTSDRSGRLRQGFTILELLAAMAVLMLLVLLISQIVSGAAGTTKISRKRVDADNEARRIFDRISADVEGLLNRPDADFLIRKTAGNDEIYFFAEAPAKGSGTTPLQPVALVGYRVNGSRQIERLAQGLSWDAAPPDGAVFLTFSGSVPAAGSTIEGGYAGVLTDANKYHVLGEGVFRLEIGFLLRAEPGLAAKFSTSPFRSGGASPFANQGAGLEDVQALVVTLVVLDEGSRTIAGDMDGLIAKFADAVDGSTPAEDWQAVAVNPAALGIVEAAASNVRVYQRIFPLNKLLSLSQ